MSYSDSFPQQRPTLNLDFANSGKLDSRLNYSRSSTGTAFSNEKHLSSENLLPYSNDLSSWSTDNKTTTPTTNNAAPDGTNTSTAVIESADGGTHYIYTNFSSVSGVSYTFVTYAKANGRTKFTLSAGATSAVAVVTFDLTAGTSTVSSGSADSHSIAAIGSTGWHKCVVTVTATGTGSTAYHSINLLDASGASSYTGDGSSGLFLWGMQVSTTGQTTLSQTSGQIHREFAPTLKTAAADAPRFEYATDGQSVGSGTAKGLLVESQATNKATYSEDFTNATYNKYRATIESAAAIAPDGTLTASFLREDATASNTHYLNAVTATGLSVGTTQYAVSVFVKAAGRSRVKIYDNNQNTSGSTTFDLSNGTVVTGDGSIQSCGNGWYRCTIVPTCNYLSTSSVYISLDNGSGTSYNGDSYSGILVWGYQLETGVSAPSSYIKSNSGSSTTRSADSCSVATADFGFAGGPVSVYADANAGAGSYPAVFGLAQSSDVIRLYRNNSNATSDTDMVFSVRVNNVPEVSNTVTGSAAVSKIAVRADTNNSAIKASGLTQQSDTSCTMPVPDTLEIGDAYGVGQLNGTIRNLMLWNVALSDTELAALVD